MLGSNCSYVFDGSRDNNIISLGHRGYVHAHHVFIDPNAENPAKKYKIIFGDFYRVASRFFPLFPVASRGVG